MYHAQRHTLRAFMLCALVLCAFAAYAIAQPVDFGQLDPDAIAGAVGSSGLLDLAPAWLAALVPPLIITVCSILNAVFKDGQMGKIAPLINKGALAVGKARTDEQAQ